jgi:ribosomal protein S18 acetylase RimI-like enzyme
MIPARIVALDASHLDALRSFVGRLPEHDLTFIKEEVHGPGALEAWCRGPERARRWVALGGAGTVIGLAAVVPLIGWSAHVGDLRLVVDPAARRRGLGAALARHALREAVAMGLRKLVVEVVAEQTGAVQMFTDLGFRGEALLTCHVRDRTGELRDLLLLAHDVDEEWSAMASLGVEDELRRR